MHAADKPQVHRAAQRSAHLEARLPRKLAGAVGVDVACGGGQMGWVAHTIGCAEQGRAMACRRSAAAKQREGKAAGQPAGERVC